MAQSIRNLALGSKIKDAKGNKFIVIAYDHYSANEVTLLSEDAACNMQMHPVVSQNLDYATTEVAYYLNNDYLKTLDRQLEQAIKVTDLPYTDSITGSQFESKRLNTKAFLLSCKELGVGVSGLYPFPDENNIPYMVQNRQEIFSEYSWTRTEAVSSSSSHFFGTRGEYTLSSSLNSYYDVRPVFNLSSSTLVSDVINDGYYTFIFNEPPVIKAIPNITGNYGSATNISYVATDSDDAELTHYISFDNGTKWQEIKPTRSGNIYTYSHVFNELNTYYCRIKVVDSAKNEVVSNAFTITVNAVAPTVNIVSVVNKVVTFKANCITSEISKVEILINGQNVKTFTSGFDFNLVYEIDRSRLNIGKNSIQIKATSQENLVG